MRFPPTTTERCPNATHLKCDGLCVTVIHDPQTREDATFFAQQLRGRWECNGWSLCVDFYTREDMRSRVRPAKGNPESSKVGYQGRYCRTIAAVFASAGNDICGGNQNANLFEVITTPALLPLTLDSKQYHGLFIFADGSVPSSSSFVRRLQESVEHDGCKFQRVAHFSPRSEQDSVRAAVGPAVAAIRASWGNHLNFQDALCNTWMLDRWAADTVVAMAEKGKPARLLIRVDFERRGWHKSQLLPACACAEPTTHDGRPKRWTLVKANANGKPTRITLSCSWCKQQVSHGKPADAGQAIYKSGAWYYAVTA
ncbi:hypothetical protein FRC06_009465 [Ceratobasidium sp. 370]|nr:hypothetical protein FRC06_009465 [Ceratobasidium sp. 370]